MKPCDTTLGKAAAPLSNRIRSQTHFVGDLVVAFAAQASQHDAGALSHADLAAAASRQPLKLRHDLRRTRQRHRHPRHAATLRQMMLASLSYRFVQIGRASWRERVCQYV